ncbi:hypothetical protein MPH_01263 [Macrophomina phaseolina MS6]|uniref:Uncharacterized protein n=2 Tax=Macrophomina phaseolina TaxID=35725 RepID=K2SG38_MACPH|nr:hypothetical protein MPH_01263 [Macrophomina phaseolina MS6]
MRLIAYFYRNLGPGCSPEDPRWQAAAQGHPMPAQRLRAAEHSTRIMDAWDADEEAEHTARREARQAANKKAKEDARWESIMKLQAEEGVKLETEEPAMNREENTASSTGGARNHNSVRVMEGPASVPPHLHKRILGKIARVVRLGISTRKK